MSPLTPEQQERIAKDMAANRARQAALTRQQRIEAGEFSLDLVRTAADPPENDPEFQKELSRFGAALRDAGVPYSQSAIAFDSVEGHGYPLPEFIVAMKVLGPPAIAALATAAGAWVQARYGRKVRLTIGDVEAEARTPEEVESLLRIAKQFQADNSRDGHRGALRRRDRRGRLAPQRRVSRIAAAASENGCDRWPTAYRHNQSCSMTPGLFPAPEPSGEVRPRMVPRLRGSAGSSEGLAFLGPEACCISR